MLTTERYVYTAQKRHKVHGQMSKELDPARISRLCHGIMEPYVPKDCLH